MSLHDSQALATLTGPALLDRRLTASVAPLLSTHPATGLQRVGGLFPGLIFLGYLYPLDLLPDAPPGVDPEALCQGLDGTPDPVRLAAILKFNPPSLRSLYQHCMGQLERLDKAGQLDPQLSEPLLIERKLWGQDDARWIDRYVTPHYKPVRVERHEHWLWDKPGDKRPRVTWRATVNVPVHRLLWHESRPKDLLLPDERLRKDPEVCPDSMYRNCVNPMHFRHALELTDDNTIEVALRRRWERGGETSHKYRWTMDNVKYEQRPGVSQDVPVLYCPQGHQYTENIQRLMRDQLFEVSPNYQVNPGGVARCAACHDQLRFERGVDENNHVRRRPRGLAQPNNGLVSQARRDKAFNDYRKKEEAEDNAEDWDGFKDYMMRGGVLTPRAGIEPMDLPD